MRHCSPSLIQHILHPQPDAQWKRWRRKKQFSEKEMGFIRRYCGELLMAKPPIIEITDEADQTSPVTLELKHNGDYRMCIGYVYLNCQVYPQIWEIPNPDSVLQTMGGHLRFSGVDGFSGFLVIPMEAENKKLTAFVNPGYGVFVWNYMPFGLQGGPSSYSKLMWKLCSHLIGPNFQVYLDNLEIGNGKKSLDNLRSKIITDTEAIDAQLDQLENKVFPIFRNANMSINASKSPLLSKYKKILGHVVSRHGISKSPELVSKLKSIFSTPVTKPEQIEQMFACLRYLSRYIPKLAEHAKFMTDKLRGWRTYIDAPKGKILPKGRKKIKQIRPDYTFKWTDNDQEKLDNLSKELDRNITLQTLIQGLPIVLIVDASPWAISCLIGQLDNQFRPLKQASENYSQAMKSVQILKRNSPALKIAKANTPAGIEMRKAKPIMFLSKVLTDTQSRWSQQEREAFQFISLLRKIAQCFCRRRFLFTMTVARSHKH
jgi:hypothetical protein